MTASTVSGLVSASRTRRRRRELSLWISSAFLLLVLVGGVVAHFTLEEPGADFSDLWAGVSLAHPFGTDQFGEDVLRRMLIGTLDSLVGPLEVVGLATLLGVVAGLLMAWRGRWVDALVARLCDVVLAFPALLFVVLMVAVAGTGQTTAVLALAIVYTPIVARYTRSIALAELALPYVEAYRVQGYAPSVVVVRYVLPNLVPAILGYVVVLVGDALMALATISYLGFGAQLPSSDWGLMVNQGQAGLIQGHPLPALAPIVVIGCVVVAVNVAGVRLAERMGVNT